jgi:hypothetical protein
MKLKKILAVLVAMSLSSSFVSAYEEASCSSDPVFAANSCNQCFTGDSRQEWKNLGFLSDLWNNQTWSDQLLFKEIQEMPSMINLWGEDVTWEMTPSDAGFWEYSEEFENLYSEDEDAYVLPDGQKVTWIKSKLGYSYKLSKNSAEEWSNIWLLVFPMTIHEIWADGQVVDMDGFKHNECVLYKSWTAAAQAPVVTTERLPDTGPTEYVLLLILALMLWFGTVRIMKKS